MYVYTYVRTYTCAKTEGADVTVCCVCRYATIASDAYADGAEDAPAMLRLTIWWTRSAYGWLCAPWMLLQGFLYPLLMHLPRTGYNAQGRVCPMATAKERSKSRDKRMFAAGDTDKDGKLDFNEFALLYDNAGRRYAGVLQASFAM